VVAGGLVGPVRLAFSGDLAYAPEVNLLVLPAAIRILTERSLVDASPLLTGHRLLTTPGAAAAFAPTRYLGVVGEAHYIWSKREAGLGLGRVRQDGSAGATVDLDWDPLIGLPVGLLGLYRMTHSFDGLGNQQDVGGSIFYTRRAALTLGIELLRRTLPLRPELSTHLETRATIGTFRLRYLW
jgi:hypothetical protein